MLLFLYKTYISEKLLAWFWDLTQHTSINNTTQSYNPSISGLCKRRRMDAMFRKIAKNNPKKWRTQSVQWLTRSQWKDKKYVWTWVNQRVATLLNDIYLYWHFNFTCECFWQCTKKSSLEKVSWWFGLDDFFYFVGRFLHGMV